MKTYESKIHFKRLCVSVFSIVCATQAAMAEVITATPRNGDRWYVGATVGFDKPWADGNDIMINPLETAHFHVDGTVMPSSITFADSSIHVALRTGTNAKIDWGSSLAKIESGNRGIAYVDVAMYGTGGLSLTSNAALNYTGGNGILLLQKDNSNLSGGISIEKGFVSAGNANAFGQNTVTFKNGGGIALTQFYSGTISNNIVIDTHGAFRSYQKNATESYYGIFSGTVSGSGKITIGGQNTYNGVYFTGTNTFSGTIDMQYGRMTIGDGGTTGSFDNVSAVTMSNANTVLAFNRSDNHAFAADISGSGKLEKQGAGALTLSGNNTFTGGIAIAEGTLNVASQSNLGTGTVTNNSSLTITDNSSFSNAMLVGENAQYSVDAGKSATFTGTVSGGNFNKNGEGTLTLTKVSALDSLNANEGSLVVDTATNAAVKTISGSGTLVKQGAANLNLSEGGIFSGTLNVTAGALNVMDGAMLTNAGTMTGNIRVSGGADFVSALGSSTEYLTLQDDATLHAFGGSFTNLIFGESASDSVFVEFGAKNTSVSSITTNAGSVFLDITGLGFLKTSGDKVYLFSGFDATGFDLSNYSLSFSRANPALGADGGGIYFDYGAYTPTVLVWNGTDSNSAWDINSSQNWKNQDGGGAEKFYQWDSVVFDDSAAIKNVNFAENVTPYSITVNNSEGNTYTFRGTGGITGDTSLTKTGDGELIIENANTHSGGTSIAGGTLTLKNLDGLGDGPIATTNDGVLNFDTSGTFSGISGITSGNTFNTSVTQGNEIVMKDLYLYSGGGLAKGGEGSLKIDGQSWIRGNLNVNAGVLELADIQNALTDGKIYVGNDATLKLTGSFSHKIDAEITLDGGTLEARTSSSTGQIGLHIDGKLQGSGNVSFYSDYEYSGHFGTNAVIALDKNSVISIDNKCVYMNGGANFTDNYATLNVAAGAYFDFYLNNRAEFGGLTGSGTITASKENSSGGYPGNTLVIGKGGAAGDTHTFSGIISAGNHQKNAGTNANATNAAYSEIALIKTGEGTQIFTGYNMSSTTTIEAGTLQFGDGVTNGHSVGAKIVNNSRLVVNSANDQTFSSAISGTGSFVKEGSGGLTLNNVNTYTGDTFINGGTLRLGSTAFSSSTTIMPFGDSITAGSGGTYSSYRGFLYDLLSVAGSGTGTTSFIGTQGDGGLPAGYNYHSGVSGDRIQHQITGGSNHERFEQRIAMKPDAMLIHMGVNDINGGLTQAQMEANTRQMVMEIAAGSPDTVIFLATIVPAYSPYAPNPNAATYAKIQAYNEWIRSFAADPGDSLAGVKIVLVDLSIDGGFPVSDKYTMLDSLHPSNNGYAWMATQWYNALMETFGSEESSALPTGTNVTIAAGASLDVNNKVATIASLSGEGTVTLGSGFITLDSASNANYAGIISGTGGLIKTGTGVQELSGANTYTGGTLVKNGTLKVSGSLDSAAVIVESGATLNGSGTVNGITTISGTLKMGGSNGGLSFTSSLILEDGANFVVEISSNGLNDFLYFDGGDFSISGNANLFVINNDTSKAVGKTYTVFSGTTATGDLFDANGVYSFESNGITYELGVDGILTIMSIVPEPGTYAAVLGAIALAFAAYRRKRK